MSFHPTSTRPMVKRRLLALLLVLFVLLSGLPGAAFALDNDDGDPRDIEPTDPPAPDNPPAVVCPANVLARWDWRMFDRYGVDANGNGLMDLPNTADYAQASTFKVRLNAGASCVAADTPAIASYEWQISGNGLQAPITRTGAWVDVDGLAQGEYTVRLTITTQDGRTDFKEQPIVVKDWLIVAMGDSYASGEGNPMVDQVLDSGITAKGAKWADGDDGHRRCHRSSWAASSLAALAAERNDPHSSVTFIFVACSGATISTPIMGDPLADPDPDKYEGSGVLFPYLGIEPPADMPREPANFLPAQVVQVDTIVGERPIDALIMSAGGNDLHFASIVEECAIWDNACPEDDSKALLANDMRLLPGRYDALQQAMASRFTARRVFITEYPDPSLYDNGTRCESMVDDILPLRRINRGEANWAVNSVLIPLNQQVNAAAQRHGWRFVDGVFDAFGSYNPEGNGYGHGYCATTMGANPQSWIRTAAQSAIKQGPNIIHATTKGTMHPNELGHIAISKRIQAYLGEAISGFTPRGQGITTRPADASGATPASVSFDNVTASGMTTMTSSATGPAAPAGYRLNGSSTYYDISTTAQFTGEATVCVRYNTSGLTAAQEEAQRLLHYVNGAWEDRTILPVDTANDTVCARTSSFSPFVVMQVNVPPTADAGPATLTVNEGVATSLNGTGADDDGDALTYEWSPAAHLSSATAEDPNFTGADNGVETLTLTVRDGNGGEATDTIEITVENVAPTATFVAPQSAEEGSSFELNLTNAVDVAADLPSLTYAFDCGMGLGAFGSAPSATCPTSDNGIRSVAGVVKDKDGGETTYTGEVEVVNATPEITTLTPQDGALYRVNDPVAVSAAFADKGTGDTHTCSVTWDDPLVATQAGTVAESNGSGTCSLTREFPTAGVYTVNVTVTDDEGASASRTVMVIVYDPSAGFVTGGGWINSPAGAYLADPTLSGKATFGFVSKYQRGATTPTGKTEFLFQAGNFRFASDTYQWLVVSGAKAQYKGTGSVNGNPGYGFLLTATDGQVSGGGGVDKFRIKIWDANGTVYDNVVGTAEDIDVAQPQALGGGSIMVHTTR